MLVEPIQRMMPIGFGASTRGTARHSVRTSDGTAVTPGARMSTRTQEGWQGLLRLIRNAL